MDPELQQAIAMINAQISQGNLQLNRDIYQNISYPTSYGQNTGFLPQDYPQYGGMPTFGAMTGTAGMFGMAGTDPRWAMLGYQPGQETLGGRQVGGGEARSDTDMSMQYGAPVVGGTLAPDWMTPFMSQAQAYARTHQGAAPTQAQLQQQVVGGVTGALDQLRADPVYQQADGARRVQLEAQAVAQATGMSVQNAASMVQDLRAQSAQNGGRMSSPQEVMDAAARYANPSDPALAVNQAMSRLRSDPSYLAQGGEGRRQLEAQAISQATGMPMANAVQAVNEFRTATGPSGGLSGNEQVSRIIQRNMPQGASLGPTGQQAAPLYGQQGQQGYGGLQAGGQSMAATPSIAGDQRPPPESDQQYQARAQQWAQSARAAGIPDAQIQQQLAQDAQARSAQTRQLAGGGEMMSGAGTEQYQRRAGAPAAPAGLGGINYAGSNAVGARATEAMSPAMRALYEQSRQFDVGSQLTGRGQDVTMRGQDITREGQQNTSALDALRIESQLRADPFALERYRRGLSSTGIPNVLEAVAGRGVLPGVQASQGRPLPPGLQEAYGALTGGPRGAPYGGLQQAGPGGMIQAQPGGGERMSGAGMQFQQRRAGAAGGMPTFGQPQMASAQQQMAALPQLNQINSRNYLRAGLGGQQYVNSAYKAAGMAGSDEDVQEAVRRGLPQFARGRMPTFGRVA